jgi:hypothetical protein
MRSHALYFASGAAAPRFLIRMPDGVPRLLPVPGKPWTYVRLGELLRLRPDLFLPGRSTRLHELRAIRLAAHEDRPVDWAHLPAELEGRLDGRVSHLVVERDFPLFWRETIRLALGLRANEVIAGRAAARPALRPYHRRRGPGRGALPTGGASSSSTTSRTPRSSTRWTRAGGPAPGSTCWCAPR